MILGIMILGFAVGVILFFLADVSDSTACMCLGGLSVILALVMMIVGCFTGFINHPKTEGVHQGVVTAVDLEGIYFRRYEVYLKSSGYTTQSDETAYKLYEYETELANELKDCIGKEVKLHYGHDGGYIGWKSCGTYHIKSVELIEEEHENDKD